MTLKAPCSDWSESEAGFIYMVHSLLHVLLISSCLLPCFISLTRLFHPSCPASLSLPQSGEWGVVSRLGSRLWSSTMVDMPGDLYSPPSPLGDSLLGSPLCGDLMEGLEDISHSIGDGTLGSFDFSEYRSTGSGSESSITLGEYNR